MADAQEIITAAFNKVQITTVTTAQTADALINLNNMVSLLGADQMMYSLTSESFAAVVGDPEYTVGTSGDWDTTRPNKIVSCYLRDASNYDWPVRVISGRDYNRIYNKSVTSRPSELYFLPEYPLAKVIFNSAPDYAYTVFLDSWKTFTEFAATTTTVTLPPEYKEALVYNLAVSLAEDWGRDPSKTTIVKAEQYKEIIARLNASQRAIPRAKFDFLGMGGTTDAEYSIVTDELLDGGAF